MLWGWARSFLAVAAICALFGPVPLSHADLVSELRTAYAPAASKLDATYSHVKVVTAETWGDQDGNLVWQDECKYLREGDVVLKIQKIIKSNYLDMPSGTERICGGSREKFFNIRKLPGQATYVFTDFGSKSEEGFELKTKTECVPVFCSSFAETIDVARFLALPEVAILSASMSSLDGVSVVDVVIDQAMKKGHRKVHLYFLPENWALAGVTLPLLPPGGGDSRQFLEFRVVYAGQDPLRLQSIHRWMRFDGTPGLKMSERTVTVRSIEFGAIPKDQLTLAAYGVDEPGSVRATPGNRWWWLLINGAICVALGIWFAIMAYRRKQRAV